MNFDKVIERTGTHSIKWDYCEKLFGKEDILPMWVADMDFESPHEVKEALKARVEHGVFGYTGESSEYFEGIINWLDQRHNFPIKKEWLSYLPGVIPGLNFAVQTFSNPGDKVIIQPPVYKPFFSAIENNGRVITENPLKLEEETNHYVMDLNDLEKKIDEKTKMIILCSPHNPVGRVWNKFELEELGKICLDNNIIIVSDEIHFDIVYSESKHYPIANLSRELNDQTITLTSPGKTFNLQGLQSAYSIISNENLRKQFQETLNKHGIFINNALSITAIEAAYQFGGDWLDELLSYLEANKNFLKDFCQNELPDVNLINSEGIYLGWLDFRSLGLDQNSLHKFLVEEAKLGLNDGMEFGEQGKGFQRINFACPRKTLKKGLQQLRNAINKEIK